MFEHSVKVPRHYKIAANIFKKVYTEGGSVKTLLYDDKLKHFRTNVLYALITETIKHAIDIEKIFDSCGILTNEPRLDPWLAKVLTAELLFGKKALPGKSKPEQTILSYKEQFETALPQQQDVTKTKVVRRPRYVRINTNLLATSDAIRAFQDEGYKFIRCTSGSYNDYLQQIQSLTEYDFTQDYHVKTVFVFAPGTKLHEHDLYLENQIILQDKATALAVHLLAPPPGSVVLDMCAAPGMKTTQLAAYLRNQGKIYAVERNEERYQTLCDFVEKTGSKCVETLHKDSLDIKRGDYDDVEYILLDPSCSGSGMDLHLHNYIEESRLARLTSLQEKFLKHAMNSFPNAKRIVYSTCSLFPEENERVITNVVKTSRAKWRVQDVKELLKEQWNNFGSGMYGSIGTRCLYSVPDSDLTTGFFLAVLDRDPKDEKSHENNEVKSREKNSKKCNKHTVEGNINPDNENYSDDKQKSKKNNIDRFTEQNNFTEKFNSNSIQESNENVDEKIDEQINPKSNKKRSHYDSESNQKPENIEVIEEIKPKHKKKKKDKLEISNVDDNSSKNITKSESESENNIVMEKKKKKRKQKDDSTTTSNEDFEVNDDISNYSGIKKKKKRDKHVDHSESLQVKENHSENVETVEDTIENDFSNQDDFRNSKKKKKKDKVRDPNEASESLVNNNKSNNEFLDDSAGKSKKKKRKEKSLLNPEEIISDTSTTLNKKKVKCIENSEILVIDTLTEDVTKKKKKKKS